MTEQTPKRLRRFVVYVPEDMHRQLRAKLALQDKTVSDWFRDKAQEEMQHEIKGDYLNIN